MIIVGLDYYRTITNDPKLFRELSAALIAAGCTVYVITAVRSANVEKTRQSIKHSKVPSTYIEFVIFENFKDIPRLKLEACKRLGVKLMLDDLPEICKLLSEHRIMTAQIR